MKPTLTCKLRINNLSKCTCQMISIKGLKRQDNYLKFKYHKENFS